MKRLVIVAVGALLVGFAMWHPYVQRPAPLTPVSADEAHVRRPKHLQPEVPVRAESVVYVVGAVAHPGLIHVPAGARIDDAIRRAGGLLVSADPAGVNLAARINDGDEIAVPRQGERVSSARPASRGRTSGAHRTRKRTFHAIVDVNTADASALAEVPGIGAAIAARIVALRASDGPFESLDQLLDVAGFTPSRLERAQRYLRASS